MNFDLFFVTVAGALPLVMGLWWLWWRGKFPQTRFVRLILLLVTAFLVAPTFMAPYGQWIVYPAWAMVVHFLFARPVDVFIYCVVPMLVFAAFVYGISSRFRR